MQRAFAIYCARRLMFAFITILFFVIMIFMLPRAIPGNPVAILLGNLAMQGEVNPEMIRLVERKFMDEFGLGLSLWDQFTMFISRTFRGDIGTSISHFPRSVSSVIVGFLPWTLALLLPATIVSWILGNNLGAIMAYKRNRLADNIITPISITVSQIPFFWFAMLMLFVFAVHLELFPVGGTHSWGVRPALSMVFIKDYLHHYALPFLTLVIIGIGGWAIGMRSMMIYELGLDYIQFADELGLPERRIRKYAFRSAMLPQITGLAINFGLMLGGSILLELVFNYRGMGVIMFTALTTHDYPLIQGIFIILAIMIISANLIVDVVYGLIDPRIKTGHTGD